MCVYVLSLAMVVVAVSDRKRFHGHVSAKHFGGVSSSVNGKSSSLQIKSVRNGKPDSKVEEWEDSQGGGEDACVLPAQLASTEHAEWCVCPSGSSCEGSGCDADKWDPKKVIKKIFYIKNI